MNESEWVEKQSRLGMVGGCEAELMLGRSYAAIKGTLLV